MTTLTPLKVLTHAGLPPPTGLNNMGNTCYLSAAVQFVWRTLLGAFAQSALQERASNSCDSRVLDEISDFKEEYFSGKSNGTVREGSLRGAEHVSSALTSSASPLTAEDILAALQRTADKSPREPELLLTLRDIFLGNPHTRHSAQDLAPQRMRSVMDSLARVCPDFGYMVQQDAHEAAQILLSELHKELNVGGGTDRKGYVAIPDKKPSETEEEVARRWLRTTMEQDNSLITDLFWYSTQTVTACTKCGHKSLNYDVLPEINIGLTMPTSSQSLAEDTSSSEPSDNMGHSTCEHSAGSSSFDQSTDDFSGGGPSDTVNFNWLLNRHLSSVEFVEDYKCEKCKEAVTVRKETKVISYPQYWLVHLKRFDFDGHKTLTSISFAPSSSPTKNSESHESNLSQHKRLTVSVPPHGLTYANLATEKRRLGQASSLGGIENTPSAKALVSEFEIVGFVNHIGSSLNYGHYVSYISPIEPMMHTDDGGVPQWYLCDDDYIEQLPLNRVINLSKENSYMVVMKAVVPAEEEKSHL